MNASRPTPLRPLARAVARAAMMLFWVVLAAAVLVESLRQSLSVSDRPGSAPAADANRANLARESVPLALTMGHKIA